MQMKEMVLLAKACFSSSAADIISSGQISSSIVTEKNRDISFKESMFGYPLPDSHFETAVLETYSASASSSCVSPLLFRNSCSFSLNSIRILHSVIYPVNTILVEEKKSHTQENSPKNIRRPMNPRY